jgi:hypothetical protein
VINLDCPNTIRALNSILLVFVILGAQFVVLTHTHDSEHHNVDALCKVCINGEHLGHALVNSGNAGVPKVKEFFRLDDIASVFPILFFTHALARAPPGNF